MKRYFYTDALAAAWMRKHFDMTILVAASTKTLGSKGVAVCFVENLAQDFDYRNCNVHELAEKGTKFIVCPTSHHLLSPKEGDVVWLKGNQLARIKRVEGDRMSFSHSTVFDLDLDSFWQVIEPVHGVEKIIERNGIPFVLAGKRGCMSAFDDMDMPVFCTSSESASSLPTAISGCLACVNVGTAARTAYAMSARQNWKRKQHDRQNHSRTANLASMDDPL